MPGCCLPLQSASAPCILYSSCSCFLMSSKCFAFSSPQDFYTCSLNIICKEWYFLILYMYCPPPSGEPLLVLHALSSGVPSFPESPALIIFLSCSHGIIFPSENLTQVLVIFLLLWFLVNVGLSQWPEIPRSQDHVCINICCTPRWPDQCFSYNNI